MSQKEYVTNILENEIQKRLDTQMGYTEIDNLPDNWPSYDVQEKVGEDGSPTEMTIQVISTAKGRDLVIADKKLKKKQVELLEKGLEDIAQAPDTVSIEELHAMMDEEEIEHECV